MKRTEEEAQKVTSGERQASETHGAGKRGSGFRNEIAMGVAIVLTVLVIFFGVRFLEDRPVFSGTYDLFTELENAGGLLSGSAVTISGVEIGEITQIRLNDSGRGVRVRMEVDDGVTVLEGSVATIQGLAALDNVSIGIEPGPEGGRALEDGAVLPATMQTDLMGRVDSTLDAAEQTFGEATSLIAGTESDLGVILHDMRTAGSEAAMIMQDSRGRLRAALVDLQSAASDLSLLAAQMGGIAAQMESVADSGGDTLVVAMNKLNNIMQRLDVAVSSLERGSSGLESAVAHVESGEGTLGRLIYDESLYLTLDSAAMRLDRILTEFQESPEKYLDHLELIDIF
jgi:phospholipid/cholesterol/gamma-HCH transport system substrate-binding protein